MEISEPSISILFLSKVFTLAPYSLQKNAKGIYIIDKSVPFIFYSSSIILLLVFLTYRGLLFDANSNVPIRMKTATSKIVTALDVSVVVLASVAGVFCGITGLSTTRELNARLRKVDETINGFKDVKRERTKALILLIVPMLSITILLGLDIGTWLRKAASMKIHEDDETDMNIKWYIPFYSLYLVLTVLHISFANTTFGLWTRFKGLNCLLRTSFLPHVRVKEPQLAKNPKITTVKANSTVSSSSSSLASESYQQNGSGKTKSLLLKLMAETHESLGKCVKLVSSYYGMAILIILVSCFLHLLATAYFLLIELFSNNDSGYVWLQILWIFFHALRLLAVVEPCHRLTVESTQTIHIICEIERTIHDSILAEEVKKFWQQLLVYEPRFSACGLCLVDRNILAAMFSGIATYLVILIQFQKSNG
ncbi:gustatory receptor for sugar taste 43a [Musca vetustissima]|uniref:gustatory receptor for sugar taste 43a n=1 Tax=Musca vetustissima TaxID=27455 RepID=UPI002AB6AF7D|nr:gustatory receptor for sugar taste 43a [Musca vetustissima]